VTSRGSSREKFDRLEACGPAMRALRNDRWRNFVLALVYGDQKYGRHTRAYRAAGFAGNARTERRHALWLTRHELIIAAIAEESRKMVHAHYPAAVEALMKLVQDPTHRGHVRALAMLMDRVYAVETSHLVKVEHTPSPLTLEMTKEVLARIEQLARRAGLVEPPQPTAIPAPVPAQPVTIEGEIVDAEIVVEDSPSDQQS
jgi:hypothetical protein